MRAARPALALSREGRDTLWLLAVLALSIYPHAGHLPGWCLVGVTGALAWRAHLAINDGALPPRWTLLVALGISVALTFLSFKSIFGREAGVTLVSVLAGLKTLELRARRDAFVITALGFFLILTQFLFSQSIVTALMMGLVFWGLLTSLVLAQRPLYRPTIWSAMKAAGKTILMGLPAMLLLYLLFPRIGPLWTAPSDAQASIGLSDQLTLGHVAELAQDDGIAMRLRFSGPVPAPAQRYFRGPVLELFDGRNWVARKPLRQHAPADFDLNAVRVQGDPIEYEMTLEPTRLNIVPVLEGTLSLQANTLGIGTPTRQGLLWSTSAPVRERTQWAAQAWPRFESGPKLPSPELVDLLQLPPGVNVRTTQWAVSLRRSFDSAASPRTLSQAVMNHIASQGYSYTLSPGDSPTNDEGELERNLIDRFWMDRKTGFCEHFATAYVVVMRAMGVPARVVTGYQGMERNTVDGLWVVRNNHAHAWAEFWQPGEGWVRADPTGAVSPDRIQLSQSLPRPRQGLGRALPQFDSPLLKHAKAFLEASNHRWNVWVLEYSRGRQLELLENWGWKSPDWVALIRLCATVMATLSALGIGWLWLNRPKQARTPWQKYQNRIDRALRDCGLPAPENSPSPAPALAWHRRLSAWSGHSAESALVSQLLEELQALDALRYGPSSPPGANMREVKQRVARIEQCARQWRQIKARGQTRAH